MTTLETLDIRPIQLVAVRSAHLSVQHKHNYYKIGNTFCAIFCYRNVSPEMNHVFEESVLWESVFFRKTENEPWCLETGANNVALEFLDE